MLWDECFAGLMSENQPVGSPEPTTGIRKAEASRRKRTPTGDEIRPDGLSREEVLGQIRALREGLAALRSDYGQWDSRSSQPPDSNG